MEKIGQLIKGTLENRVKDSFKLSQGMIIIKYSGVSSPDMSVLRKTLKLSGSNLLVVKNSIAKRAMEKLGLQDLVKSIESPCGMVFFKDEPVGVSKILCAFRKDHEKLVLEGGLLQDKLLTLKDIEVMSALPSKDLLRGKLVMVLNAPILKLAIVLNQTLKKFVYCLDQIRQKKSKL